LKLISFSIFMAGVGISTPAFALTVSPVIIEVAGDPGQTLFGEIELYNEQEGTRTFYSSFENFETGGDSGAPKFIGAEDGLAIWMQTETSVTLKSGERKKIPFKIMIPKEAVAGGYFAAIFWGSQPTDGKADVFVGGKLGILVLLRVNGDIEEGAGLTAFSGKDGRRFFTTLPVTLTVAMRNTGGDRIVPQGEMVIKNTFGFTTTSLTVNKQKGSVLPGGTRKYHVVWEPDTPINDDSGFFVTAKRQWDDFHWGAYKAAVSLQWGQDQAAKSTYRFFVFPWQLLTLLLGPFLVVLFLGKKAIRRYNRWIVAQAAGRQAAK
jgi:hypothetical protein